MAGLSVVVLERGQYPGSKNVSGGILYRQPTEQFAPGFEAEAPLERPIIEQRYLALTEDAMLGGIFRSMKFAEPPYNAYSVLRSEFDQWFASTAEEAGAEVYPEFTVVDLLWEDGKVAGVTTGDAEGELLSHCVVLADGANSLLAKAAGLHREWHPSEQALIAKELIALPAEKIDDGSPSRPAWARPTRSSANPPGVSLAMDSSTRTRSRSRSAPARLLQDLIESGRNVNDMLDRFKQHPAIAPLIAGGETIEYAAHLIPELDVDRLPQVYADGVVVIGDAAGLLNPVNREGANLSMLSGRLAAETIVEAKAKGDFSARTLAAYRKRLDQSIILDDMKKVSKMAPFAHDRPHLFSEYPTLAASAALEYLTVDGISKKEKQKKMAAMFAGLPKRRLLGDAIGALKSQL